MSNKLYFKFNSLLSLVFFFTGLAFTFFFFFNKTTTSRTLGFFIGLVIGFSLLYILKRRGYNLKNIWLPVIASALFILLYLIHTFVISNVMLYSINKGFFIIILCATALFTLFSKKEKKKPVKYPLFNVFVLSIITSLLFVFYLIGFSKNHIDSFAKDYTCYSVNEMPKNRVALILGTSMYRANGNVNLYFQYRIEAAVKLFNEGKVNYFIVSGDNHVHSYNKPKMMRKELEKNKIPKERIYEDYTGFRTFDSVIRSMKVFDTKKITIISQKFHAKRAIFIARKSGIDAIGFVAKDVNIKTGFNIKIREGFARVKALLDVYILNTEPKFLGEKISIGK